ncbi:hypothetical protein D9M68_908960 [compost metagenome]
MSAVDGPIEDDPVDWGADRILVQLAPGLIQSGRKARHVVPRFGQREFGVFAGRARCVLAQGPRPRSIGLGLLLTNQASIECGLRLIKQRLWLGSVELHQHRIGAHALPFARTHGDSQA